MEASLDFQTFAGSGASYSSKTDALPL